MNERKKLDASDLVSFEELLIANSFRVDALAEFLIDEGIISKKKFFAKLKEVQAQYTGERILITDTIRHITKLPKL
jgi:hypothetical protein